MGEKGYAHSASSLGEDLEGLESVEERKEISAALILKYPRKIPIVCRSAPGSKLPPLKNNR